MARTVFLTGITGFAGSHLAERLLADGDTVHGYAHEDPPYPHLARVIGHIRIHRGDINDLAAIREATAAARPEVVFHLAGQAVPTLAARDPLAATRLNVLGTATLLAALADHPGVRLVIASSADVYGVPEHVPVAEEAPVHPSNVYAATKIAAEALAREFGDRSLSPTTILRPVNQLGPRQHPGLAASAFAKQIAEAEAGLAAPVVRHGALDAKRDFIDVRDMAAAYVAASNLDEPGTALYNVGSGSAYAIGEILETLLSLARVELRAELDPARVRHDQAPLLTVDATRFRRRTGWSPRIDLRTSLSDTLEHWRSAIRQEIRA